MDKEAIVIPFKRVLSEREETAALCRQALRELDEMGEKLYRQLRQAAALQAGKVLVEEPVEPPPDGPTVVRCADRFRSK